jgi:hypothetical protein
MPLYLPSCSIRWHYYLVGGCWCFFFKKKILIFPNQIGDDDPIWLSYFSGGLKAPIRKKTTRNQQRKRFGGGNNSDSRWCNWQTMGI